RMQMSNRSVSSTRASWPRARAASASTRVLYSSGCRDRMTMRMAGPFPDALPLLPQCVLSAHVHHAIAGQRLPAEDDGEAHLAAVGGCQANGLGQRAERHPRL